MISRQESFDLEIKGKTTIYDLNSVLISMFPELNKKLGVGSSTIGYPSQVVYILNGKLVKADKCVTNSDVLEIKEITEKHGVV